MYNSFFEAICRTGIFMICAQAIIHFRPQETYEKYLKLLVSIMVLIQLFLPLGSFLLGGDRQKTADALEQFKQEMEKSLREIEESSAEMEALLEQMTLEEVRRRMAAQEESAQGMPEEGMEGENALGETDIEMKAIEPVTVGPVTLEEPETDD